MSLIFADMTGLILFTMYPFPQANLYLQYVTLKDPLVYSVLVGATRCSYSHSAECEPRR